MYREPVPPTFQPIITFSKGPVDAIRRQNRMLLVMALMFGLLTLAGVVAMWVISGFSNVLFFMASPLLIVLVLISILRGKIRGAAELVVDVAYSSQTQMLRITSPAHATVELPIAEVSALAFRENPRDPVRTGRGTFVCTAFDIVAETPNGDVEVTQPLVCTGTAFIAAGRANLQKILPDVNAKIEATKPPALASANAS